MQTFLEISVGLSLWVWFVITSFFIISAFESLCSLLKCLIWLQISFTFALLNEKLLALSSPHLIILSGIVNLVITKSNRLKAFPSWFLSSPFSFSCKAVAYLFNLLIKSIIVKITMIAWLRYSMTIIDVFVFDWLPKRGNLNLSSLLGYPSFRWDSVVKSKGYSPLIPIN